MTEAIKVYLDEQAEKDAALKAKYKPELIDKCVEYINSEALKIIKEIGVSCGGGCKGGYISDPVVYKWARDYFIEDIAAKQEEERKKKEEQAKLDAEKKTAEKAATKKAEKAGKVSDELEVKPVITTKKAEKKQPEQMLLFNFGDEDA